MESFASKLLSKWPVDGHDNVLEDCDKVVAAAAMLAAWRSPSAARWLALLPRSRGWDGPRWAGLLLSTGTLQLLVDALLPCSSAVADDAAVSFSAAVLHALADAVVVESAKEAVFVRLAADARLVGAVLAAVAEDRPAAVQAARFVGNLCFGSKCFARKAPLVAAGAVEAMLLLVDHGVISDDHRRVRWASHALSSLAYGGTPNAAQQRACDAGAPRRLAPALAVAVAAADVRAASFLLDAAANLAYGCEAAGAEFAAAPDFALAARAAVPLCLSAAPPVSAARKWASFVSTLPDR